MRTHVPQTTAAKLAELANLVNKARDNNYRRIQLAVEAYDDKAYWESSDFVSTDAVEAFLQEKYLADLCDAVSFQDVYQLYKSVPNRSDWVECRYSLRRLYALMLERRPKEKSDSEPRKRATVAELTKANEELYDARAALKNREDENAKLRQEIESLRQQLAFLKGQIEELRKAAA